jgi:hypothetical protein
MSAKVTYQAGFTYNRTGAIRPVPTLATVFDATDAHILRNMDVDDTPAAIDLGELSEDNQLVYLRNPEASTGEDVIISSDNLGADKVAQIPPGQMALIWKPAGDTWYASIDDGAQKLDYAAVEIEPPPAP